MTFFVNTHFYWHVSGIGVCARVLGILLQIFRKGFIFKFRLSKKDRLSVQTNALKILKICNLRNPHHDVWNRVDGVLYIIFIKHIYTIVYFHTPLECWVSKKIAIGGVLDDECQSLHFTHFSRSRKRRNSSYGRYKWGRLLYGHDRSSEVEWTLVLNDVILMCDLQFKNFSTSFRFWNWN